MSDKLMNAGEVINLVRRYAEAIAAGRIEPSQIKTMSDDELFAFDEKQFDAFDDVETEAEQLEKNFKSDEVKASD